MAASSVSASERDSREGKPGIKRNMGSCASFGVGVGSLASFSGLTPVQEESFMEKFSRESLHSAFDGFQQSDVAGQSNGSDKNNGTGGAIGGSCVGTFCVAKHGFNA